MNWKIKSAFKKKKKKAQAFHPSSNYIWNNHYLIWAFYLFNKKRHTLKKTSTAWEAEETFRSEICIKKASRHAARMMPSESQHAFWCSEKEVLYQSMRRVFQKSKAFSSITCNRFLEEKIPNQDQLCFWRPEA